MKTLVLVLALVLSVLLITAEKGWCSTATGGFQAKYKNAAYVPTPRGWLSKECVHSVPSGAHIRRVEGVLTVFDSENEFVKVIPRCQANKGAVVNQPATSTTPGDSPFPPDYDGWLAYTAFNYTAGMTSFLGDFSVPANPASDPDVLYLFTGLQNIDWIPIVDPEPSTPFDIIQPVLQYPGDLGDYWSVKSWFVTLDEGAMASDEVVLKTGDYVFGNMTQIGTNEWYIGSTSGETKKTTSIHVTDTRLAVQPWAYVTLECYGCTGCSTYPSNSPCNFTNMEIFQNQNPVTPTWKPNPKPSHKRKCDEKPVIVSPSEVVIDFGN